MSQYVDGLVEKLDDYLSSGSENLEGQAGNGNDGNDGNGDDVEATTTKTMLVIASLRGSHRVGLGWVGFFRATRAVPGSPRTVPALRTVLSWVALRCVALGSSSHACGARFAQDNDAFASCTAERVVTVEALKP